MTRSAHVLIIDDDEELTALLSRYLGDFDYQVSVAEAPGNGLRRLRQQDIDVLLLDVMLPEQDGLSVCREIRANRELYGDVPVLMLTARGEVVDRVVGLELGADDYLTKPFEPRELLARIRSLLRRRDSGSHQSPPLVPGLSIDRDQQRVWLDQLEVELTGMEWQLLVLLSSMPGKMFSRDDIMHEVMGIDADVYSRAVDALVSRLRAKLGDTAKTPRFIKTVWGRGYVFLAKHQLQSE